MRLLLLLIVSATL